MVKKNIHNDYKEHPQWLKRTSTMVIKNIHNGYKEHPQWLKRTSTMVKKNIHHVQALLIDK